MDGRTGIAAVFLCILTAGRTDRRLDGKSISKYKERMKQNQVFGSQAFAVQVAIR